MLQNLKDDIQSFADPELAKLAMRYFKTGKGEYGHGDVFLGLTVPEQRKLAKKYKSLNFADLAKLMRSRIHEYRFIALVILAMKVKDKTKIDSDDKKQLREAADFYLKHRVGVNNWDLVDTSAPRILGEYLFHNDRKILYRFAKSKNLWERRIAIITTLYFIRQGQFDDTLAIAKILLYDKHDLIHKAVGWMLREVGNMSRETEEKFLREHYRDMPRTMLRYAVEKFPPRLRAVYMYKVTE